jgi:hypothetical protein
VDKYILAATGRLNKSVTLRRVEPLYGICSHSYLLFVSGRLAHLNKNKNPAFRLRGNFTQSSIKLTHLARGTQSRLRDAKQLFDALP